MKPSRGVRESVLRAELVAAIDARDIAASHLARIKIAMDRGKVLLDEAERKFAELEASAKAFEECCGWARSFTKDKPAP